MPVLVTCRFDENPIKTEGAFVSKIRKCNVSEHILHMKILPFVSEIMLHTKVCNVRTYDTQI